MTIKNPRIKLYIAGVLLLAILFIVWLAVGVKKPNKYTGSGPYKKITVATGSSVDEISKLLEKEGLINSGAMFKLYVYAGNRKLQAGNFYIPTGSNIAEIVVLLGKGSFQERYTFLEGWRIEQMAQILPANAQNEFINSIYTKEGFTFPDTYFFASDASGEYIAKTLRQTFDEKVKPLQPQIDKSGLSLDEIVSIASIVEREAGNFEDKTIIAGILIKRYKNNWPLQADATVQYAKDSNKSVCASSQDCTWWEKISAADLELESPYNTYKKAGLPPTPISNPGLDSIRAVLEYKETPFWFYLTGKDGVTYYSRTIEEHTSNIQKYL